SPGSRTIEYWARAMRAFRFRWAGLSIVVDDRLCADELCVREDALLKGRFTPDVMDGLDDLLRVLQALAEECALLVLSGLEHLAQVPGHIPGGDADDASPALDRLERLHVPRTAEGPRGELVFHQAIEIEAEVAKAERDPMSPLHDPQLGVRA